MSVLFCPNYCSQTSEVLTPMAGYICNNVRKCPKFRLLRALGTIVNGGHGYFGILGDLGSLFPVKRRMLATS